MSCNEESWLGMQTKPGCSFKEPFFPRDGSMKIYADKPEGSSPALAHPQNQGALKHGEQHDNRDLKQLSSRGPPPRTATCLH